MKTNSKVQKALKKLEKRFIVYPTSHDVSMIEKALQQMYDLGHADGYAAFYYDHEEALSKLEDMANDYNS